jgi:hypothetical protein
MNIIRYEPDQWSEVSEKIHRGVFQVEKPKSFDRISFALVAYEYLVPLGYLTCQEMSEKTLYIQFGGAFPKLKHSPRVWMLFETALQPLTQKYEKIFFLVENTNRPMLKLALKSGFLISGVRFHQGKVLVEHALEFEGA